MEATAEHPRVHTQETTGDFSPIQSYQSYRRSLVAEEYIAVESTYSKIDERDELRRVTLLQGCRNSAWFVRHIESGHVHVASNSCRLRWCPMCSRAKSAYITNNVAPWISSLGKARFMTLTLRHTNAPLLTQIQKLYADFRKLRKDKQFRKSCQGGVWFFQIKLSEDSQQWHPHVHCVLNGQWISKEWLSRKWHSITQSSYIVDIKLVRDPDKVASEVARYSATPAQLRDLDADQRVEVFDAMHRRRLCGTWGTAKKILLSPPRTVDKKQFEDLGGWSTVLGLHDDVPDARAIYEAWKTGTPLGPDISVKALDDFIEDRVRVLQSDIDAGKFDPIFEYQ
ncbi:MAG: protein rep [Desulfobacteraceae bacterium]|nr:protein rep [Desulfobacteraceae bacterium]